MDNYKRAKKRVEDKKQFYRHLTSYVTMSIFFFLLNAITSFGAWWFYWPMLGWGIGIVSHYFRVFGVPGTETMNENWEQREMEKEMRRLESKEIKQKRVYEQEEVEELDLNRKIKQPKEKSIRRDWDDSELV